jgi:hypothetical protein
MDLFFLLSSAKCIGPRSVSLVDRYLFPQQRGGVRLSRGFTVKHLPRRVLETKKTLKSSTTHLWVRSLVISIFTGVKSQKRPSDIQATILPTWNARFFRFLNWLDCVLSTILWRKSAQRGLLRRYVHNSRFMSAVSTTVRRDLLRFHLDTQHLSEKPRSLSLRLGNFGFFFNANNISVHLSIVLFVTLPCHHVLDSFHQG